MDKYCPDLKQQDHGYGLRLLKDKYQLHLDVELKHLEKSGQNPTSLIRSFLNRINAVLSPMQNAKSIRNFSILKRRIVSKQLVQEDQIKDQYWLERGITSEQQKNNEMFKIREDQKNSLSKWLDFLFSQQGIYPDWVLYDAFRDVLGMGLYDLKTHTFSKRDHSTISPYPDLQTEAACSALEAISIRGSKEWQELDQKIRQLTNQKKALNGKIRFSRKSDDQLTADKLQYEADQISATLLSFEQERLGLFPHLSTIGNVDQQKFMQMLGSAYFSQLYGWFLSHLANKKLDLFQITTGKWIYYEQNSDHQNLVKSLQGNDTGWSTVGEATAKKYLSEGGMYVFYSDDHDKNPTIPRLSIKMKGDAIQQVRGIAPGQNIEANMLETIKVKLREFQDYPLLEKRLIHNQKLADLEAKNDHNQQLTTEELRFLYEIDQPIETFGFKRDPRIAKIRSTRDREADLPKVFNCRPDQIARDTSQVSAESKVYLGPLVPGLFELLQKFCLEHIYTEFPEKRVCISKLSADKKTPAQLREEMSRHNIKISLAADVMLKNLAPSEPKEFTTVLLSLSELGFTEDPTIDQIYYQARKLGLDRCPEHLAVHQRINDLNQPSSSWYVVAMKRIEVSEGDQRVFRLLKTASTTQLHDYYAYPTDLYPLSTKFLFIIKNSIISA